MSVGTFWVSDTRKKCNEGAFTFSWHKFQLGHSELVIPVKKINQGVFLWQKFQLGHSELVISGKSAMKELSFDRSFSWDILSSWHQQKNQSRNFPWHQLQLGHSELVIPGKSAIKDLSFDICFKTVHNAIYWNYGLFKKKGGSRAAISRKRSWKDWYYFSQSRLSGQQKCVLKSCIGQNERWAVRIWQNIDALHREKKSQKQ